MTDVKTLSGAAELYREGRHARSTRRGAPVAERARKVHVDYVPAWVARRGGPVSGARRPRAGR